MTNNKQPPNQVKQLLTTEGKEKEEGNRLHVMAVYVCLTGLHLVALCLLLLLSLLLLLLFVLPSCLLFRSLSCRRIVTYTWTPAAVPPSLPPSLHLSHLSTSHPSFSKFFKSCVASRTACPPPVPPSLPASSSSGPLKTAGGKGIVLGSGER